MAPDLTGDAVHRSRLRRCLCVCGVTAASAALPAAAAGGVAYFWIDVGFRFCFFVTNWRMIPSPSKKTARETPHLPQPPALERRLHHRAVAREIERESEREMFLSSSS